jgi:hypothetical protein
MTMSGETPGMPDAVVDALMRASRALVAITARSLSSVNEEVTLAQFRTLVVLSTRGPQTVTALAEHLDVHASTMTRMCPWRGGKGALGGRPPGGCYHSVAKWYTTR